MPMEFSVIVPVYNAESWLRQCVDSILGQRFGDLELLLVDDGSTDTSPAICDEYADKDHRVRVLHQQNAGPTPARRNGLDRAGGEYICFVDSDDWVEPNWLEVLHGHILAHGRPDMLLFNNRREPAWFTERILADEGYYDKARLEREIYPHMLLDWHREPYNALLIPGYLWNKVYRRQLLAAHFVTETRLDVCEDIAMTYECLYWARDVYICQDVLYVYRYREQSNLHHYRPDFFWQMRYLLDYLREHMGGLAPYMARQINDLGMMRLLDGMVYECIQRRTAAAAARFAGPILDETGLARTLSLSGLPLRMKALLALVKCRLYRPAFALVLVKLRGHTETQQGDTTP